MNIKKKTVKQKRISNIIISALVCVCFFVYYTSILIGAVFEHIAW
jgi:hypothetical protein